MNLVVSPWRIKKIVLPQHADHAGVMWHGTYISWLEESRIDALLRSGMSYQDISAEGLEMPVVSLSINYLKTIHHGEEVILETFSLPRKGVRWPWKTSFIIKGNELAAEARVELVIVRQNCQKTRLIRKLPDQFQKTLLELQHGPENSKTENH